MSQTRLDLNTINFDYLQVFHCEHDTISTDVFEWVCTAYQTQDSELFLTDGYPRFGTFDRGVAMFINAGATTEETALLKEDIMFMGAT